MSATRDPSQKVKFVYANFHDLFKKGLKAAQDANVAQVTPDAPIGLVRGKILKASELTRELPAVEEKLEPVIREHRPVELISERIRIAREARREVLPESLRTRPRLENPTHREQRKALEELRGHVQSLNQIQARLSFMLKELEELTKT